MGPMLMVPVIDGGNSVHNASFRVGAGRMLAVSQFFQKHEFQNFKKTDFQRREDPNEH